ncbi:MAG: hypothetical protein WCF24_01535 [Acidimicrobiales bacterium]
MSLLSTRIIERSSVEPIHVASVRLHEHAIDIAAHIHPDSGSDYHETAKSRSHDYDYDDPYFDDDYDNHDLAEQQRVQSATHEPMGRLFRDTGNRELG